MRSFGMSSETIENLAHQNACPNNRGIYIIVIEDKQIPGRLENVLHSSRAGPICWVSITMLYAMQIK